MRISQLCLLLFIILFNVEAKDFDFSKTYVCKTHVFQLNFNEEDKTCNVYGLFGIPVSHYRYMERRDYRYCVVEDTLVLYPSDDFGKLFTYDCYIPKDEKRQVFIALDCIDSFGDSLGFLSPEYSVFINDSLYVNSYEGYVKDSLSTKEILYDSNLEKDKVVIEYNCSHAAFFKKECYSDGSLTIELENCQEYIAKLIISGGALEAIPGSALWLPYVISYDHKAIFKPRSKIWLKRWHRKHPISKSHLLN